MSNVPKFKIYNPFFIDLKTDKPSWQREAESGEVLKFYVIDQDSTYITTAVYKNDEMDCYLLFRDGAPVSQKKSLEEVGMQKELDRMVSGKWGRGL